MSEEFEKMRQDCSTPLLETTFSAYPISNECSLCISRYIMVEFCALIGSGVFVSRCIDIGPEYIAPSNILKAVLHPASEESKNYCHFK